MSEETASNALVTGIIKKFQDDPSIIKTKENHQEHFSFLAVALKDVNMDINYLIHLSKNNQSKPFFLNLLCIILVKAFLLEDFLSFSRVQIINQFFSKTSRIDK